MTQAQFVVMGGFAARFPDGKCKRVSTEAFAKLVELGYVKVNSELAGEIRDKSKASSPTKAIACIQITWFLAQLSGRAKNKLHTSTLEIFTLAVVICSLTSYAFWWNKPLDVRKPIMLSTVVDSDNINIGDLIEKIERKQLQVRQQGNPMAANPQWTAERRRNLVPLYIEPFGHALSVCTMVLTLVFAGCHFLAWNGSFPSDTERLLWRICTVGCGILPIAFSLLAWDLSGIFRTRMVNIFLIGLYVMLRMYMVVEVFAGLRSVPEGVYTAVTWSHYFPHL
jgi:hypothetical protein